MTQAPTVSPIELACRRLSSGDVVAIPTETVYGLAASIESESGLRKVFALKERPFFDPLIVHVASFSQARSIVREWPALADFVSRMFWPGPLTLILPKAKHVNTLITSGLDTVAVRIPRHPLALELIRKLGAPVAAPSANRFGKTSPSRASHVASEFPKEDLLILDGGDCEVGLESTVVAVQEHELQILRPGGVSKEELEEALSKWSPTVKISQIESAVQSPGHLKHHYMPDVPLIILPKDQEFTAQTSKVVSEKLGASIRSPVELVLDKNPILAARQLYTRLRECSESGADLIYVKRRASYKNGAWDAIWDRLNRAATLVMK